MGYGDRIVVEFFLDRTDYSVLKVQRPEPLFFGSMMYEVLPRVVRRHDGAV